MADPKRSELVKATKELNTLLTPEPLMDTKAKGPDLIIKLNEAAVLLEKDDAVSEATQVTLVAIGAELPKTMLQPKGKGKEKAAEKTPGKAGKDTPKDKPKAGAKGKETPKAKPKADAKPKAEKNKFNRRKGTNTDMMDNLFIKGTTIEKAVEAIVEATSKTTRKTEAQALAMIKAHVRDFDKITTGFTLNESKKGIHKAVADE